MRSDFNRERSISGEQHRGRDNKKDDRDRSISTPHQWSSSSRVRSSSFCCHNSNRRRQDSTRGEGRRHTTESLTALFKKTVDEHRSRHSRRRGNDVHRDSVVEHKRSKSCDTRNKARESNKSESRIASGSRTRGSSGHKNEARKVSNEEVKTVGRSQASTSSYQYTTQPHRSRKDRQGRDQRHDITQDHKRPQGMKAPPPPPPRKLPVEKDTPDSSSRSTSNATSQSKALSYVHNLQCSDRTGGGAGLYTGEVDQWRRPHGQGFMKYTTGQFYEGTFCNGEPNAFEFQQQNLPQTPLLLMYNM